MQSALKETQVMNGAEIFRYERAKGSTIGATIVGGFGAVWLTIGLVKAGIPLALALVVVLPVFALIAVLGSVARRRLPKFAVAETPEKRWMMRWFNIVNAGQWVAILLAVNVLRNLHLDAWVIPSIVLIIGAHFLPLARIFRAPQHRMTGIALMLCAILTLALPGSIRDVVECVVAGLILWTSAAGALHTAFRVAPQPTLASQAGL
jgi:hypothetical protein